MKYRSRNNKIDQIYSVTNEPEAKFVFIGPCSSVVAVAADHVRKPERCRPLTLTFSIQKLFPKFLICCFVYIWHRFK